jgi:hypothetical protein
MTMTAYATKELKAETLAAAVLVMEAYRGQGDNFPGNFDTHPAIKSQAAGEGFSFTADMSGLMSPVAFGLNRQGGVQAQIVSLSSGKPLDAQIEKAIGRVGGPSGPAGKPKPGV